MINEAKRPIVYFGGGVRSAVGCQPLRDLLTKADIPATYTLMAAGVLSYGEEHNLGLLGMHAATLPTRPSMRPTWSSPWAHASATAWP